MSKVGIYKYKGSCLYISTYKLKNRLSSKIVLFIEDMKNIIQKKYVGKGV